LQPCHSVSQPTEEDDWMAPLRMLKHFEDIVEEVQTFRADEGDVLLTRHCYEFRHEESH